MKEESTEYRVAKDNFQKYVRGEIDDPDGHIGPCLVEAGLRVTGGDRSKLNEWTLEARGGAPKSIDATVQAPEGDSSEHDPEEEVETNEYQGLARGEAEYWRMKREGGTRQERPSPREETKPEEVPIDPEDERKQRERRKQEQSASFVEEVDRSGINVERVSKDVKEKKRLLSRFGFYETRGESDLRISGLYTQIRLDG